MAIDQEFLKSIGLDNDDIMQKIAAKSVEDETGLLNKRDELLGKVTDYKSKLNAFDGVDVDQYRTMLERLKGIDEKNLIDKGEFDKLIQLKTDEADSKYGELTEKYASLSDKFKKKIEGEAVLLAVGDKGDGELILGAIKQNGYLQTVDTDAGIVLKITSLDGKKELESIDDLISEMSKSTKFARLFNASGLSGGGARQNHDGKTEEGSVFGASRMAAARQQ